MHHKTAQRVDRSPLRGPRSCSRRSCDKVAMPVNSGYASKQNCLSERRFPHLAPRSPCITGRGAEPRQRECRTRKIAGCGITPKIYICKSLKPDLG
jgi:hypothetical protein